MILTGSVAFVREKSTSPMLLYGLRRPLPYLTESSNIKAIVILHRRIRQQVSAPTASRSDCSECRTGRHRSSNSSPCSMRACRSINNEFYIKQTGPCTQDAFCNNPRGGSETCRPFVYTFLSADINVFSILDSKD